MVSRSQTKRLTIQKRGKTKLRIISDIHIEFAKFRLPKLPDDEDTILIIAGDLGVGKSARKYFEQTWKNRFKKMIYVLGNHEFYNNNLFEVRKFWNEFDCKDLIVLDNNSTEIDGKIFFGATLWTDCNQMDPMDVMHVQHGMNDFRCISYRQHITPREKTYNTYSKFTPEDAYQEHIKSIDALELTRLNNKDKDLIVITHHLPTLSVIHPMYKGDALNPAFASDLDELIQRINPRVWMYGHTHTSNDSNEFGTRFICNPRGYANNPGFTNKKFDPKLTIYV